MEQAVPEWLSSEFLKQCLQHEKDYEDIEITKFTASSAISVGEQYGSCPIRVKIEYRKQKGSDELSSLFLVLKSELKDGTVKEILDTFEFSESIFYQRFIPKTIPLTKTPFAARSFYSPKLSVIILEDLKEKRFVLGDKKNGLDFEHCRLYVAAAASLHAASLTVLEEDPELISIVGKEKMFVSSQPVKHGLQTMVSCGLRCLAEYTETSDKFNKYTELIRDCSTTILDTVIEAVKPRKDEFNAMNHGDAWTNNMMFRYNDKGSPCEVRLLDFAITKYASPLNDIVYFIWTSASDNVRTHRLDELYAFYVEELNKNLKRINRSESMSHEEATAVVRRLLPLGFFMAVIFQPFIGENAPASMEPFFTKEREEESYQIYNLTFSNEKYRQNRLPKLVHQLEIAGVFEFLESVKKTLSKNES
uniref:CHK kinase-like domain-containing protein n=1 Tax=Cuerna arida TaxID=1464854 RepID=A0A1B6GPN4_9HEMI